MLALNHSVPHSLTKLFHAANVQRIVAFEKKNPTQGKMK
jgi:hypothetical protein